jgi:hypothetical protein
MKGLCKRVGVKRFGFKAMRQYVASVLAGIHKVSAKRIQELLRHKNVTATERYIHMIQRDQREPVNLLKLRSSQEELTKADEAVGNGDRVAGTIWQSQGVSNPCLRRERALPP